MPYNVHGSSARRQVSWVVRPLCEARNTRRLMSLPLVRMDFNSNSLANPWTREDLERQGINLREGMRCIFYDFDAEYGVSGLLHTAGVVWWDSNSQCFRIDMRTVGFQFTPGNDIGAISNLYLE
jgi:hypothetical protein